MKKICFVLLLLVTSGFAALPPLAESAREIRMILAHPQIFAKLGNAERIEEIVRKGDGYSILTEHLSMQVDVIRLPNEGVMGPAKMEFHFHEPVDIM